MNKVYIEGFKMPNNCFECKMSRVAKDGNWLICPLAAPGLFELVLTDGTASKKRNECCPLREEKELPL